MENWRNFTQNMNKDRYAAPGEASSDPTPSQEDRFDQIFTRVSDIAADAMAMPEKLHPISSNLHLMYDPEGDQYMVFTGEAADSTDNYRDLFYGSEKDSMIDQLAHEIYDSGESMELNETPGPDPHGMLPHSALAKDLASRGRLRRLQYGDKTDLNRFLSTLQGETGQGAKKKIIDYLVGKRFGNYVDYM